MKVAVDGAGGLWVENWGTSAGGNRGIDFGGAQGIDACARSYAKQKALRSPRFSLLCAIQPCRSAAAQRRNVRRADMAVAFGTRIQRHRLHHPLCPKAGQAPDGALPATAGRTPPRHGLKSKNSSSTKPGEKNRPVCPHLKVANRSVFVAEGSPARCVSEREKGGKGWL